MKFYIIFFLFFFAVSCQTVKSQSPSQITDGEESATDVIGEQESDSGEFADEDELEDEFADSEDFEKEMADEAFPSDDPSEETEDQATEKDSLSADSEESPETKEESGSTTEDTSEEDMLTEDDTEIDEDETIANGSTSGLGVVVNSIRYEAGENKIYIDGTGSLSYQSRENKDNNQFIIEIPGATLSESLQERPFVMKDFHTDMALLQADQKDSNTVRIVLQMRENAGSPSVSVADTGSLVISSSGEAISSSLQAGEGGGGDDAGSSFSVQESSDQNISSEILPAKSLEEFFLQTPQFTGAPISIQLNDVDVKEVLYFISEGTGLNMVLSDNVEGKISIKLKNIPWDQALVTVMKMKDLGYLREGNVIRIMRLEDLRKEQKEVQEMREKQKVLEPLKVKVIPLAYTAVTDIEKQVKDMLTKDRGKVTPDTKSNSLIITDTTRNIERIETMVKNLDKLPIQVMIEAKIVEARESFVRNLGVSWGFQGAPLNIVPGGNPNLALNISGGLDAFPGGVGTTSTLITRGSGLRVSFAPVGDLDLALGLSEIENLIHVLSAPRIMVLNGEKATISQQTEDIDVVTTQSDQTTQTAPQRIQAVLEFEVSPEVTAVGSIYMEINMRREFFGAQQGPQGARPKNSRSAKTKVLVGNGQTIVIGGIYQKDEARSDEGIPILRHIPILNWLFSKFTKSEQRNELLLFLTPRIVDFTGGENNTAEIN